MKPTPEEIRKISPWLLNYEGVEKLSYNKIEAANLMLIELQKAGEKTPAIKDAVANFLIHDAVSGNPPLRTFYEMRDLYNECQKKLKQKVNDKFDTLVTRARKTGNDLNAAFEQLAKDLMALQYAEDPNTAAEHSRIIIDTYRKTNARFSDKIAAEQPSNKSSPDDLLSEQMLKEYRNVRNAENFVSESQFSEKFRVRRLMAAILQRQFPSATPEDIQGKVLNEEYGHVARQECEKAEDLRKKFSGMLK